MLDKGKTMARVPAHSAFWERGWFLHLFQFYWVPTVSGPILDAWDITVDKTRRPFMDLYIQPGGDKHCCKQETFRKWYQEKNKREWCNRDAGARDRAFFCEQVSNRCVDPVLSSERQTAANQLKIQAGCSKQKEQKRPEHVSGDHLEGCCRSSVCAPPNSCVET